MSNSLTHLDERGNARMVDVGGKPVVHREAIAEGRIVLQAATLRAIADGSMPKGDVIATARIAGIMAAKRCGELIPLCHPLGLESVEIDFVFPTINGDEASLVIRATTRITAKTGVEMEALTAVSVAALTIYDMCKAIDKQMRIEGVCLISKTKSPVRP
jgi:cyclic pyranopterin phosphate synthase